MSQNIYGTPVFFNFSLVQNYIMSYFHCNTIFEVYRWLKIFIFWLPLMYSRSYEVISRRYTILHIYIYRFLWLMEPPSIWINKKVKLITDYILSRYFLHVLVSTVSVIWYQSFWNLLWITNEIFIGFDLNYTMTRCKDIMKKEQQRTHQQSIAFRKLRSVIPIHPQDTR